MKKQLITISLTTCLAIGGAVYANNPEVVEISQTTKVEEELLVSNGEFSSDYITYSGVIKEVTKDNNIVRVLVENKESESFESIAFNISEDVYLLSSKTKDFTDIDNLQEGDEVSVHYGKNTPMTRSLPPQLTPSVVVINDSEEMDGVKVDRFNSELISVDNFLKANVTEETIIVDRNGNTLEQEDIYNKDLVVFYGPIMTMSIPGQSHANKIILLESEVNVLESEVNVVDRVTINGEEKQLENKIYKSGSHTMIPLREIAEALDYNVEWNQEAQIAEISKGAQFITVKPNEDRYSFAKMLVKLNKASELKDGSTYVPLSFIDKVLKLDYTVSQQGIINIK